MGPYVVPSSPDRLMESTTFDLNFSKRNVLRIGLDPQNDFNVVIYIITKCRHIALSPKYFKKLQSVSDFILEFLQGPIEESNITFMVDSVSFSTEVYQKENVVVIEAKKQNGCRVMLNRADIITLFQLSNSISEMIEMKRTSTRCKVLQELEIIASDICNNFNLTVKENFESRKAMIILIFANRKIYDCLSKDLTYTSQIRLYAMDQLTERVQINVENAISSLVDRQTNVTRDDGSPELSLLLDDILFETPKFTSTQIKSEPLSIENTSESRELFSQLDDSLIVPPKFTSTQIKTETGQRYVLRPTRLFSLRLPDKAHSRPNPY